MKKEDAFERVADIGAEQIATKFSEAQLVEIWEALYSSPAPLVGQRQSLLRICLNTGELLQEHVRDLTLADVFLAKA